MVKIFGYARVSTAGQSYEIQEKKLKENGCEKVYADKATGTNSDRTQFKQLVDVLREGDILKVTKIDRLARSIIDLNKIIKKFNEMGVTVVFLDDNLTFSPDKSNDPMQNLLFNVLSSFAQFERDMIVSRTSEGRERARRQGKHLGRPSKPKKDIERALQLYEERENNKMSVKEISKTTGVPRSTIYNELKKKRINSMMSS